MDWIILPRNNISGSKLYNMSTLKLAPWYTRPLSELGRRDSIVIETVEIRVSCVVLEPGNLLLYCIVVNQSVTTKLI